MTQRAVGVLGIGLVGSDEPVLHSDDLGLTRGDGCFEATRVVTDEAGRHRVDHLPEHLDRFDRSCAGLALPPIDRPDWQQLVEALLVGWRRPGEAMLKLMLSRGRESRPGAPVTGLATLTEMSAQSLRQRREGIAVITLGRGFGSRTFLDQPWLLGGIKTLSYAVNVAAGREAARRGADDVLFTSADGYLLEAPTSTLVWLVGDQLRTSTVHGTGVLASITQQALFEAADRAGYRTGQALIRPDDLAEADGVWLVSSGRGVARLTSLDGDRLAGDAEVSSRISALAGF